MEFRDVFDEDENKIGEIPNELLKDHHPHYITRSVHILLFNEGKILSQLRAEDKWVRPSEWSTSVQGGVSAGEDPENAAYREMKEELGIETKLTFLGKFRQKDEVVNEFVYVYMGEWSGEIHPDDREIADIAWYAPEEILENPDNRKFEPNIVDCVKLFSDKSDS